MPITKLPSQPQGLMNRGQEIIFEHNKMDKMDKMIKTYLQE